MSGTQSSKEFKESNQSSKPPHYLVYFIQENNRGKISTPWTLSSPKSLDWFQCVDNSLPRSSNCVRYTKVWGLDNILIRRR